MYENARKALDVFSSQFQPILKEAIIEALRPYLLPDGCVAVCERHGIYDCVKQPFIVWEGTWKYQKEHCTYHSCPLKPKEPA